MHDQHVSKSSPCLTDSVNDSLSDLVSIKVQILENFKNLIIGHLNINSSRNKFEMMVDFDWQSEMHDQHVSKSSPCLTHSVNNSLSDLVSIKVQILENFKNLIIGT